MIVDSTGFYASFDYGGSRTILDCRVSGALFKTQVLDKRPEHKAGFVQMHVWSHMCEFQAYRPDISLVKV